MLLSFLIAQYKMMIYNFSGHVVRKKCIIGSSEYAEPIGNVVALINYNSYRHDHVVQPNCCDT